MEPIEVRQDILTCHCLIDFQERY